MYRSLIRLAPIAAVGLAATALAPTVQAQDMRYLSWTGKPAVAPAPAPVSAAPTSGVRYPSMAAMGRPSRYSPSVASGGLTPADAWFNPVQPRPQPAGAPPYGAYAAPPPVAQPYAAIPTAPTLPPPPYARPTPGQPTLPVPAYAAAPTPMPMPQGYPPMAYAAPTMAGPPPVSTAPLPAPVQQAAPPAAWTQPGYAPQVYAGGMPATSQPAPAPQAPSPVVSGPAWASPQPAMTGATVADPMAPRRDAPIFSIQAARDAGQTPTSQVPTPQPPSQPMAQGSSQFPTVQAAPPREGARYYSVHRQAGREPDPAEIPDSVYAVIPEGAFLDAARPDLADPPPAPLATRNINGRIQAMNRGDDPSLP